MKIFVVVDETPFYHPDMMHEFLKRSRDEIVGCALVVKIPRANSIEQYLKRNWRHLYFSEMGRLALSKYGTIARGLLSAPGKEGPFYSVRSVLKAFDLAFFEVETSINKREYLDRIRQSSPDVVLSSNSLIFKQELLEIPEICCLNRHSALLPSYGGLWPAFHAYRNGENQTGVSVHTMELKIDKGIVLAQRAIPIENKPTLSDLYEKCFALSPEVILEALDKIRANDFTPCANEYKESYFSFPTDEHWSQFRARGGRFI